MDNKKNHFIARKEIQLINLFAITSNIEVKPSSQSPYPVCKDVIYFEFFEKYDYNSKIPLMMNAFELRKLIYACKELFKTGESDYKKYSDPGLANNYDEKGKKSLSLSSSCSEKNGYTYFLNLSQADENRKFIMNKYELLAFCDTLKKTAEDLESTLHHYQRTYQKAVKKGNNGKT